MKWLHGMASLTIGLMAFAAPAHSKTQTDADKSDYPNKAVTLIVPYAAGGAADVVGRMFAEKAASLLGQSMVVENRPGAGGGLAGGLVAKAKPDGYTLLLTSVAIGGINPHMSELQYAPLTDLAPVAIIGTAYTTLVVNAKSPFNSLADLLEYGRKNPGKLNYGSSGKGSITHLTAELFGKAANVSLTHVPYRGNPQVINDLVGGDIQMAFDGAWLTNVNGGLVKALAYTGKTRNTALPQVPTIGEAGVPNYQGFEPWIGIAAPAGTPDSVLNKLEKALLQASKTPELVAKLEARGMEPRSIGRQEMAEIIKNDYKVLGSVIHENNR